MKYIKPILAAVIAVTIAAAVIPFALPAKAAVNGVQKKLDEIRAVYPNGSYFTADGQICRSRQNDNCRLSLIPARGGLPSGAEVYAQLKNESWSCRSFADYVFYYTFGEAYWNLKKTDSPMLGDFIKLNNGRHSAIYLWEDADNYYVFDSNGDSTNVVCYNRAFPKSGWKLYGAYHADNYDKIMNGGSAAVFSTVDAGSYFISSSATGLYLSRTAPKEGQALFTLTAAHRDFLTAEVKQGEKGAALTIPVNGKPQEGWLFEVAAGGYVIRSEAQPAKALTAGSNGHVALSDFNGSASQLWKIETVHHNTSVVSETAASCTARGERVYVCADCDYTFTEYESMLPHVYTVETVEPGERSYGFTKYKCVNCGEVNRKDVKEKLDPEAPVEAEGLVLKEDGRVYVSSGMTEEALLDAFPGYEADGKPASATGKRLTPKGQDSVPEKDILTVIMPGDVDGDGAVTAIDARIILRACVSKEPLKDENARLAADVDFDGEISAEDARWILRTSVGYETGASTLADLTADE